MKILVTGSTGFIGNVVVNELLRRGHEVIASSTNNDTAQKKWWYPKVIYRKLDFRELNFGTDYFNYFDKPDIAIHLAWEGLPRYKEKFHLEENLPRHAGFLTNLVQNGLKSLTVTGTCLEYGLQNGCLKEDITIQPIVPYAIAKNKLREVLQSLQGVYQFSLKWVRLFYMFGPGQNPNSLVSQLDKAIEAGDREFNMSQGDQTRDFLPVEKVGEYLVRIALQDSVDGIINCCSNTPVTVRAFVENYLKERRKNIDLNLGYYPYLDYEPMHFWGDDKKLKTILNND
jgi:dTDP-6-deoxy-L-talose 4-dehydrogenase (NAD+)